MSSRHPLDFPQQQQSQQSRTPNAVPSPIIPPSPTFFQQPFFPPTSNANGNFPIATPAGMMRPVGAPPQQFFTPPPNNFPRPIAPMMPSSQFPNQFINPQVQRNVAMPSTQRPLQMNPLSRIPQATNSGSPQTSPRKSTIQQSTPGAAQVKGLPQGANGTTTSNASVQQTVKKNAQDDIEMFDSEDEYLVNDVQKTEKQTQASAPKPKQTKARPQRKKQTIDEGSEDEGPEADDPTDKDFIEQGSDEEEEEIEQDDHSEDSEGEVVAQKKRPTRAKATPTKRKTRNSAAAHQSDEGSDSENDEWAPAGRNRSNRAGRGTRALRNVQRKTYEESDESDEDKKKSSDTEVTTTEGPQEEAIERICDDRIVKVEDESEVQEFLIKWKGWANIHNSWHTREYLKSFKGIKKLDNYLKKKKQFEDWKVTASPEEVEQRIIDEQLEKQIQEKWVKVDRILGSKPVPLEQQETSGAKVEYLVKWKHLPYSDCTWEYETTIAHFPEKIEEFKKLEHKGGYNYPAIVRSKFVKLEQQPAWVKGTLRDYQLEGINWLYCSFANNTNVILADEMGLGKTIQTITFLAFLYNELKIPGPFMVVVPLSTISNWVKEFKRWAPELYVVPYIGDKKSRSIIKQHDLYMKVENQWRFKSNVILTTYEHILKDQDYLKKIKYSYMAVDEAHRLKNDQSKLYQVLIDFHTYGRLLITGTPLQNSLKELWCLLHFLMPEKFDSFEAFEKRYGNLKEQQEEIGKLHEELAPHLLRRLKADVEKSLPRKIERILRVELSALQKQYYTWILKRNFQELSKAGKPSSLLNIVVELKKCCNHPFLFDGARERVPNGMDGMIKASGKLLLLDKLLVRLKETGHRVLIFSQMVRMLDILGEYLSLRGFTYQRLDGSTSSRQRQQVVEHFNAEGSPDFCFLLSTRAGGLGINLATADTVIIFDSDWNPQNDLQAEARAHRIGQKNIVNIYRLIMKDTVEEQILERAKQKMILDHLVIQKMDTSGRTILSSNKKSVSQFTKEELTEVLKFGAENLFKSENGSESKIGEMDIEEILARAEVSTGEQSQGGSSLMNSFKVANFTTSSSEPPIKEESKSKKKKKKDDFWSKLIPENERTVSEEGPDASSGRKTRNSKNSSYGYASSDEEFNSTKLDAKLGKIKKKQDRIAGFNMKDTKAFIKSFKKFADMSKIEKVIADAKLDKKTLKDAEYLANKLIEACKEACAQNPEAMQAKPKEKDGNVFTIKFNDVEVSPGEVIRKMEEIALLKQRIGSYDSPSEFRTQSNLKSVRQWPVKWELADDADLLRGILAHGIGNWEAIQQDSSLNIGHKISTSNTETAKKIKPMQLHRRVDFLLQDLVREVKEEENAKKASKLKEKTKVKKEAPETPSRSRDKKALMDELKSKAKSNIIRKKRLTDEEIKAKCKAYLDSISDYLEKFRKVTDEEDKMTKQQRLAQIKESMMVIGARIDEVVAENHDKINEEDLRRNLWEYVKSAANTSGDSITLENLYKKLKEKHKPNAKEESLAEESGSSVQNDNVDEEPYKAPAESSSRVKPEREREREREREDQSNLKDLKIPKRNTRTTKRIEDDEQVEPSSSTPVPYSNGAMDEDDEKDDDKDEDYTESSTPKKSSKKSTTPKKPKKTPKKKRKYDDDEDEDDDQDESYNPAGSESDEDDSYKPPSKKKRR